jgi:hypothetical protein
MIEETRIHLNSFIEISDDALYNTFKKLKEKYPEKAGENSL